MEIDILFPVKRSHLGLVGTTARLEQLELLPDAKVDENVLASTRDGESLGLAVDALDALARSALGEAHATENVDGFAADLLEHDTSVGLEQRTSTTGEDVRLLGGELGL